RPLRHAQGPRRPVLHDRRRGEEDPPRPRGHWQRDPAEGLRSAALATVAEWGLPAEEYPWASTPSTWTATGCPSRRTATSARSRASSPAPTAWSSPRTTGARWSTAS